MNDATITKKNGHGIPNRIIALGSVIFVTMIALLLYISISNASVSVIHAYVHYPS